MNLLGKVFTGLVLLLSVIFFALSVAVNASHINQKEQADKFQKDASDAQRRNTELNTLLENYKTELAIEQAARRSALASLQTQLEDSQSELQTQEATLADVRSQLTQLVQTEKATQLELKAKTADNDLLRQQIKQARQDRDQLFQRLVDAKDSISRLQGTYDSLSARARQLAADHTAAREKLEILGISEDTLLQAPPAVNGQVLAVETNGLVEVSLGRDDGLREGFTLEVHRNGEYMGRLKVRTVRDDKAIAEILVAYQKGNIRAGDRVDSKLL